MPRQIAKKAFHVTLWAAFPLCVDLLVGGRFLELNSEVDHGDIKGRNAQSHANEYALDKSEPFAHFAGKRSWNGT